METLKVRPVLVESKENTGIILGVNITRNIPGAMRGQNYELILISLKDEKIEESKERYFESSNGIIKVITDMNVKTIGKYYNIIARQSQISPEYIAKFIEQYNNGCVEDLEIEMEEHITLIQHQGSNPIIVPHVVKIVPKLTNGFVTIIGKEPQDFPYILQTLLDKKSESNNTIDLDAYTSGLLDCYKNIKEPITYTEQEVKNMLGLFGKHIMTHPDLDMGEEFEEATYWFNNNKKK